MKNLAYLITLFLLPFLLLQCKKKDNPEPIDQLPSATQSGANTFGCLLNGQAWTPKGNNGTSNYSVYYDPSYAKGTLNITTYRYTNTSSTSRQTISIYSDSLSSIGTYMFNKPGRQGIGFNDRLKSCDYNDQDKDIFLEGSLTITRLDLNQGIISGTFEFTLAKPGCDTIKVTNGRFDKKL